MNNQIKVYKQRLFGKLFATLPYIKKTDEFKIKSSIDFNINHFFYFKNKDFWFADDEKEEKYYFLFGLNDKPISKISGRDTSLIIDFDKNIQFNESCLGLFYIKNFEIRILINNKILKERYPNINVSDFKTCNFKPSEYSQVLEVIDLGGLDHDFIDNVEKLIKVTSLIKPQIPKVVKTDSFGNKTTIAQMNIILEDLANGKSEDEAIIHAKVSNSTYKYWINRGKQDFGAVYVQFYHRISEIKSEYGSYGDKESDEESIEEMTLVDGGFYEPLLMEYEDLFNSMNQTGIAWVDKIDDGWCYSRTINDKTVNIIANNIPELYKKVKNNNLIWGIRDYDRAKKFIDIPDDFEIPLKPQADDLTADNREIDPNIYAPLPSKYENSFNSMNRTGIAWVNQMGSKLYYVKSTGKRNIRFSAKNIYDLYDKVKKANQIWGIRDYSKASNYIDIPKDFEIPQKQENEVVVLDDEINESIYVPLSKDQLSKFNPNPNNKTGIAWVNKVGNKWFYQRQRNGKTVRFSDSNIIKLHEKVIKNNQIWGIIDIDKARKAIETNSIEDKQYPKSSKTKPVMINSDIAVTCIEKSINEFDILIKGVIKNKDLIEVLTRLDLFKENIKRIIITSINKNLDIFIELEMNKNLLFAFEEKIEDFGWEIKK